ncbi:MAG: hypothetical protein U0841_26290 [Chloroflexia bacterium]
MERRPMRVGLIGLGAIGRAVVRLIAAEAAGEVEVVGALVRDPARPRREGGFRSSAAPTICCRSNPTW